MFCILFTWFYVFLLANHVIFSYIERANLYNNIAITFLQQNRV